MLCFLAACAVGLSRSGVDASLDDAAPLEPDVDEDTIGDQGDPAAWFFALDRIHTIDIEIPPEGIASLAALPYEFTPAAVTVDGDRFESVGVELRGHYGSFRTLDAKPKLRVKLNAYVEDQRWYGLESLSLDNTVVDCSYLKQVVGYAAFAAAGEPASRTSYAEVRVNGADYGLYVVVETPDDRFLARNWKDPEGNLYDGKYRVWADGSYTLLDFATGVDELFELEEGADVAHADIVAVSTAVTGWAGQGGFADALDPLVDWPAVLRHVAVETWIGHLDGYTLNTNNYRVYFDPDDGRAELVPWDLDYAFLEESSWGMSWSTPRGRLMTGCYADPACVTALQSQVAEVASAIDVANLDAVITAADSLTLAAAQADPRRECDSGSITPSRDTMRAWVSARTARVRALWGF